MLTGISMFDFGMATSPVATGYTGVNPATTFSSTLGYGWLSGAIDSRDRGALAGTTALTEDFDMTPSGTFAVNVPNGTYNVTVTLGDACYAHGPMTVSLQGTQVGSVSTAADQFAVKTYQVAVTTGQLDLGLVNAGSSGDQACIDCLAIAPTTTTPPRLLLRPSPTSSTSARRHRRLPPATPG